MPSSPALLPVASGFLSLEWFATGERATATATLSRAPDGGWRLIVWPTGALVPVVMEGREPTPCADALIVALFGDTVRESAGD